MSDEPPIVEPTVPESESESEPAPVGSNQQAALDSLSEGEELVECPTCHNQRRAFTIVDGECDSCRTRNAQAVHPAVTLDWPEIRHRRNLMLADTDSTQVEDYPLTKKLAIKPLRQSLRDVTQQSDPLAAYRKLDELERDIQLAR